MLLDLLFPKHCLNCKAISSYICPTCLPTLQRHNQICIVCRQLSPWGTTHQHCQKYSSIHHLIVACIYKDTIKEAIHEIKYHYAYDIIKEMCDKTLKSEKINRFLVENKIDFITEVPLHPHKLNHRGFNLPNFIANWLHKTYQIPHQSILTKIHHSTAQAELKRQDRLLNPQNMYQLIPPIQLSGKRILLVDDVLTTGATLESAAKELAAQQTAQITGLVLASSH